MSAPRFRATHLKRCVDVECLTGKAAVGEVRLHPVVVTKSRITRKYCRRIDGGNLASRTLKLLFLHGRWLRDEHGRAAFVVFVVFLTAPALVSLLLQ